MTVLLVRHTEVAKHWRGRCYGASDAGLSRAGITHARALALQLAAWQPDIIVHSGLRRAAILATETARHANVSVIVDRSWQERDFGIWERKSWTAIHRATGNAMDGMIDNPESFRPGGGETTFELADRAWSALTRLPHGRVIVVTHGGPIAALIGGQRGLPARDWLAFVPSCGDSIELNHSGGLIEAPFLM